MSKLCLAQDIVATHGFDIFDQKGRIGKSSSMSVHFAMHYQYIRQVNNHLTTLRNYLQQRPDTGIALLQG